MEQSALVEWILWIVLGLQGLIFIKVRELTRYNTKQQTFMLSEKETARLMRGLSKTGREVKSGEGE